MSDELIKHYENYKTDMGDRAYSMERCAGSSRIRYLEQFIKANVPLGGKILDIGCGDMFLSKILPEYQWVGIDIATDMSDNKAIKQDLMTTPYPLKGGDFDAAICSEVLEHLWDLRVVHKEVKRLLKKSGTYIISTPNFDNIDHLLGQFRPLLFNSEWSHSFEHIRFYNLDSHTKFLQAAGFEVLTHVGCDAQFVQFFNEPRRILYNILTKTLNLKIDQATSDMILGQMFSYNDHTIMLVAKSV